MSLRALSVDIKDLYYSLPQSGILLAVKDAIDRRGAIAFQNEVGITIAGFLELLQIYFESPYVTFDKETYLQKQGVCIGSSIAPILSDLLLGD